MVIGPFWLLMKLMDGPLRVFDIYEWPPFAYEALVCAQNPKRAFCHKVSGFFPPKKFEFSDVPS